MSGKKHKREVKRQKELAKQLERQAERRRTLITVGVILLVVASGFGLAWGTVSSERKVENAAACGGQKPKTADDAKPTFGEAPQLALRDGDYTAVFETSCGRIVVDLYEDKAPVTVNSFVALSTVGFYDGLQVFRNAPSIFALQTGAGDNQASFQVGYTFADELKAAEEEGYTAGSLAMANSGPNTNGSQFFFVYDDSSLPPQYSKFGQVTEGLDVLKAMGAIPVDGETPQEKIYIDSVRIQVDGKDLRDLIEADRDKEKAKEAEKTSASPKATASAKAEDGEDS